MSVPNKFWFYPDFIVEGWSLLCVSPENRYDGCLMIVKREALDILRAARIATNYEGDIATDELEQARDVLIQAGWEPWNG